MTSKQEESPAKQNVSSEFSKTSEENQCQVLDGDDSEEDPPVPIPNTEVKLFSVEDTWLETARENREMPTHIFLHSSVGRAHDC